MGLMPAAEVARLLLRRPLPYATRPKLPIRDPNPDAGLFGPHSVTWRVMGQPVLMLGAGRALLLQAANPLVAEGAIEHSDYAVDPFGRLQRTVEWVTVVCFGTTAEARDLSRHVNRLHRGVVGEVPAAHATRSVPAGTPYRGNGSALLRWVHATFVDTMLVAHEAFVGPLSEADGDAFVVEWHAVGRLMGVPARLLWPTRQALSHYVRREVESGRALPGPGSRLVARTVLRPPAPLGQRPLWEALAFTTLGLLPEAVREAYGIRWSPAHDAAHGGLSAAVRALRAVGPPRLRTSPVHQWARARAEGRLGEAA